MRLFRLIRKLFETDKPRLPREGHICWNPAYDVFECKGCTADRKFEQWKEQK
jgi:hypothetical protein